jgi:hypothetical protein
MVSIARVEELVTAALVVLEHNLVISECGFGGPEKKLRIIAAPFLFFLVSKNQQSQFVHHLTHDFRSF